MLRPYTLLKKIERYLPECIFRSLTGLSSTHLSFLTRTGWIVRYKFHLSGPQSSSPFTFNALFGSVIVIHNCQNSRKNVFRWWILFIVCIIALWELHQYHMQWTTSKASQVPIQCLQSIWDNIVTKINLLMHLMVSVYTSFYNSEWLIILPFPPGPIEA